MSEPRVEALSLAMALAPGVYARNRMFAFFQNEGVRRARKRSATLRGVARQLGRAENLTVQAVEGTGGAFMLRYGIAEMRLTRMVELTALEISALRVMCARLGVTALDCSDEDRLRVDAALSRLLDDPSSAPLSQAARGSVAPPDMRAEPDDA